MQARRCRRRSWTRIRYGEMGFCLAGALNKNSREVLLIAQGEDGPEYDHHNSQWKSGWGHQSVEEKDVDDHWPEQHQRERYKSVHQQE